jgi:hypothetical protein
MSAQALDGKDRTAYLLHLCEKVLAGNFPIHLECFLILLTHRLDHQRYPRGIQEGRTLISTLFCKRNMVSYCTTRMEVG